MELCIASRELDDYLNFDKIFLKLESYEDVTYCDCLTVSVREHLFIILFTRILTSVSEASPI